MFPLLDPSAENPVELFQIWLNLPAADKMAEPRFGMLWSHAIPKRTLRDATGRATELTVIAGRYRDIVPAPPPPSSWAARADSDVAIWTLRMEPGATWTLPGAQGGGTRRTLYFFKGGAAAVAGRQVQGQMALTLQADAEVRLEAGQAACEFLLLQGRPIGEPVAQHGPFVMNTPQEILQAMQDYRRTQFGGWPFDVAGPVHGPAASGRFAKYPDGRKESPLG